MEFWRNRSEPDQEKGREVIASNIEDIFLCPCLALGVSLVKLSRSNEILNLEVLIIVVCI